MQKKRHSFLEAITSTAIGFLVTLVAQCFLFPYYGIQISVGDNLQIVAWMTVISVLRQYVLRRVFNRYAMKDGTNLS
jgi:hypothetical protein